MILNEEHYRTLWEKFEKTKTLNTCNGKASCLTTKIILEYYWKNQPIHFNFQNSKETIFEIGRHLFIELANDIYTNHYDLPTLAKGNKLRDKRKYTDGKKHDYIITNISSDFYSLEHIKNKAKLSIKYDDLVKKFIPIEQGTRQSTLFRISFRKCTWYGAVFYSHYHVAAKRGDELDEIQGGAEFDTEPKY